MESEIAAWLVAHGFPAWLCPDALTFVGVAGFGGGYVVLRAARRAGASLHEEARTLLLAFITSWLGGFLFEAAFKVPEVISTRSLDPLRNGGADMYAALIAGSVVPAAYLRIRGLPVATYLDRSTLLWGTTIACTRLGCFLNGCDYGFTTSSFVGLRFPRGTPAADMHTTLGWVRPGASSLPVHPTQLYEAAVGLGAALIAWFWIRTRVKAGGAFVGWLGIYATGRFLVEFLRADASRALMPGLTNGQIASMLILALLVLVCLSHRFRHAMTLFNKSPGLSKVRVEPESETRAASM
jgi:prolipoprotein diacylglyceryltransferase